jgi:hypothetical protein
MFHLRLILYPRSSWNSLCRPGWSWTHDEDTHASPAWILELKVFATTPSSCIFFFFFFLKIYLFIICKYTVAVFRHTRRGSQILLRMVVSHHVVAGIWTLDLWKSSRALLPTEPSHQPSCIFLTAVNMLYCMFVYFSIFSSHFKKLNTMSLSVQHSSGFWSTNIWMHGWQTILPRNPVCPLFWLLYCRHLYGSLVYPASSNLQISFLNSACLLFSLYSWSLMPVLTFWS